MPRFRLSVRPGTPQSGHRGGRPFDARCDRGERYQASASRRYAFAWAIADPAALVTRNGLSITKS